MRTQTRLRCPRIGSFTGAFAICFLFPFFLDVFIVSALCIQFAKKQRKDIVRWLIAGAATQLTCAFIALLVLYTNPSTIPQLGHSYLGFILWGGKVGIAEKIVRHYTKNPSRDGVDRFTGDLTKMSDGKAYSLGPDGKDDSLRVVYDPTNGMFSRGDIPIQK